MPSQSFVLEKNENYAQISGRYKKTHEKGKYTLVCHVRSSLFLIVQLKQYQENFFVAFT